jgi:endonuclease/exonuclease/phosphatase family metal-dependent hydrolase
MPTSLRIATFNLENFDDRPEQRPSLSDRIAILRPQLVRLRADVLCLQEVNGQEFPGEPRQVAALEELLTGTPYESYFLVHTKTTRNEAYDERNLVIVSRFPITAVTQIKHTYTPRPLYRQVTAVPPEAAADDVTWERPLFYATLDLGLQGTLHLINLHLKSKRPVPIEGQMRDRYTWRTMAGWAEGSFISALKRVGQALEVRVLLDEIFDGTAVTGDPTYIAVCGDFNDDLGSVPLKAICGPIEETNNAGLVNRIMIPCEMTVPEPSRYSLFHRGKGEMIDHILVTRDLLTFYQGTEIHNEILPDKSGFGSKNFPESDHAPIVAEFVLP